MHLACVNLRMTMEESLTAATINAAASLGRSHTHGSLEPGKVADMLVIDAPRYKCFYAVTTTTPGCNFK